MGLTVLGCKSVIMKQHVTNNLIKASLSDSFSQWSANNVDNGSADKTDNGYNSFNYTREFSS